MVEPHFSMLWDHTIPRHVARDDAGRTTEVTVIAGPLGDADAAAAAAALVGVARRRRRRDLDDPHDPGRDVDAARARAGTNRTLYFFRGKRRAHRGPLVRRQSGVRLRAEAAQLLLGTVIFAFTGDFQSQPVPVEFQACLCV